MRAAVRRCAFAFSRCKATNCTEVFDVGSTDEKRSRSDIMLMTDQTFVLAFCFARPL